MTPTWYCPRCFTTFTSEVDQCVNLGCRLGRLKEGWPRVLEANDVIDRNYLVLEFIALGGAGITYRAQELDNRGRPTEPDLAIKVLHARRDGGAFLKRLANEARILQELHHEHIVECLGFVHRAGRPPYLVTRFEGGGSLEQFVSEVGPLPPTTVAGIMAQVFDALDVAHANEVIHRDLKPANILLERRLPKHQTPRVRVADFGIAKVSGLGAAMTRTGAFVGTPQYAAPEQFLATPATPATDVFAAGAVAAFLLAGRPYADLGPAADIGEYYTRITESLPPQLPTWLEGSRKAQQVLQLVRGTMAFEPTQRWSVEYARTWLAYVLGLDTTPPPPPIPAPRPMDSVEDGVPAMPLGLPSELPARPATADTSDSGDDDVNTEIRPRQRMVPPPRSRQVEPPAPPPTPDALVNSGLRVRPAPVRTPAPEAEVLLVPPAPRVISSPLPQPPPVRAEPPVRQNTPPPVRRPPNGPSMTHIRSGRRSSDPTDLNLDDLLGAVTADDPRSPPIRVTLEQAPGADFRVPLSGRPRWLPHPPVTLPVALPDDARELLILLGQASQQDRQRIVHRLLAKAPAELNEALDSYRSGESVAWGRGVGLAIELVGRPRWEPVARSLLADEDAGVRCAAAAALAKVGEVPALQTLGGLMRDGDPRVRATAARALAELSRTLGRRTTAVHYLRTLQQDPHSLVQQAVAEELLDLE